MTQLSHVFLTGATGFVGKVVLGDLLRRREELGIDRITVLVRAAKGRDGQPVSALERFDKEIFASPMFASFPQGWEERVDVLQGELEEPSCGLLDEVAQLLCSKLTHVVHCAASVDFNLPVRQAAAANISASLHVLELARRAPQLQSMVAVSTAYVTAWRPGPIPEALSPLPRDAQELYRAIMDGSVKEEALLAETGHPNTYTLTKCLAEHLLHQRKGDVPLTIVRPSIVCGAWSWPVPGWIDSPAALTGCLLQTGLGIIRTWVADPNTRLDVIPVDIASNHIVEAAFSGGADRKLVRHAVMGIERAMRVDLAAQNTVKFFECRSRVKFVPSVFVGKKEHGFGRETFLRQTLPTRMRQALLFLMGRQKERRLLGKLHRRTAQMNAAFRYFTHHTFDFRPDNTFPLEGYTPERYLDAVNRGICRYLLAEDETQSTLAGKAHRDGRLDLRWVLEKPHGSWTARALGYGMRKTLRRCTESVSYDRLSFEKAVSKAPPDCMFVLAPSHRSYFDFLLASYLCFQHPELRIPMPFIAAAEDFSRLPVVGKLLPRAGAFFVRRGVGKETPELNEELRRLASLEASIMFFVEGQRSRDRRYLAPRRGLLRGLQATGRNFCVLPIAISYDRVPEESALERELRGGARSRMSLTATSKWLCRLARKRAPLGRIHIACGEPLGLDASTDVHALASAIVREQQRHTTISQFHLKTFLSHARIPGVDEAWLTSAIEQRGGRVLQSALPPATEASFVLHQSLCNQWMHWFYRDARALFSDNPIVQHYLKKHDWMGAEAETDGDERTKNLVAALFEPIIRDHWLAASSLRGPSGALLHPAPRQLLHASPGAHLPHLEDAYALMVSQGILSDAGTGHYAWGPSAPRLDDWLQDAVPELSSAQMLASRGALQQSRVSQ
jgi:nucleoside-diphosphate-sugar epimerase/1-acyl-sn-glycerol-3-phosphate acyltransferase